MILGEFSFFLFSALCQNPYRKSSVFWFPGYIAVSVHFLEGHELGETGFPRFQEWCPADANPLKSTGKILSKFFGFFELALTSQPSSQLWIFGPIFRHIAMPVRFLKSHELGEAGFQK